MKIILRSLLALLVVSAGLAWAADGPVEENLLTPQIELPEPVEPADDQGQEITVEDLETMEPDLVEAGACCMAECLSEKFACLDACGFDSVCLDECVVAFNSCRSHC